MKGVIMAGGFGTRLRPLTFSLPKPMVPVANRPIMQRIVELLRSHGIVEQVALLFYQPETIRRHFGDGSGYGVRMAYVGSEGDLGTAGSVKLGQKEIGEDRFMVISADILTDFDLSAAIKFHEDRKAKATLVLTRVENPLQFGVVIADRKGRITRFLEKPSWGEVFSDTVNTGIYILEPEVLELIPEGRDFDFSKDLFPLMLKEGLPLYGYIAQGYWKDIGTLNEYLNVHRDILGGKVAVDVDGVRGGRLGTDVRLGAETVVDPSARLSSSVILGRGVKVGPRAILSDCIIGDACIVGEGARIQGAVLWDGVVVGAGSELKECSVAGQVRIGERSALDVGAVVSDGCSIGSDCRLKAETKMWPKRRLENGAILSASLVWGDKWGSKLFDNYGISGTANVEMTPEFATKLGAAYGAGLPLGSQVLVTRDAHKTSRMLDRALMAGLLSAGIDVLDMRLQPIPVARHLTQALKTAGGLHVRRSPFERDIQDLKFFGPDGLDLSPLEARALEKRFHRGELGRTGQELVGDVSFPARGVDLYEQAVLLKVNPGLIRQQRFKVVVDLAHGSGVSLVPRLLAQLGVELVSLNAFVSEVHAARDRDQRRAALKELCGIVRSLGADLGVMLDASAQKLALCGPQGEAVEGEDLLLLMAWLQTCSKPASVLAASPDVAPGLEVLAKKWGAKVLRCGPSNRDMMSAARNGADLAGDGVGGIAFGSPDACFDGILATVWTLERLAALGLDLAGAIKLCTETKRISNRSEIDPRRTYANRT